MKKYLNSQDVKVFDICRDIEIASEELYFLFAEIFRDDPVIATLWRKTALEERNHAEQFKLAMKIRIGMIETVEIDTERAEWALGFVRAVLLKVREMPPTLHDALRFAIELEEKLEDFHMHCAAQFTEESYRKMFAAMMSEDRGHMEMLRDAYRHLPRRTASDVLAAGA